MAVKLRQCPKVRQSEGELLSSVALHRFFPDSPLRSNRMHHPSILQQHLRENLCGLLSGNHTPGQLNGVIRVAHALATAFLASKRSSGTLSVSHGLSVSDLAYDCIADIFQRNDAGVFVQINAYFSSVPLDAIADEELLAHLRRLVFSKVNHGVFRLFNESDPTLAKILRNTKLAIAALGQFVESERFGEHCIAPSMCETLEHLPSLEREYMENHLLSVARGNESVPDLIAKLGMFLRDQTECSRIIPLVTVAYALRTVYESGYRHTAETADGEPSLSPDEMTAILRGVCNEITNRFSAKYIGKKLQPEVFAVYMKTIESGLVQRFVYLDGDDKSLYEQLETMLPGLTKEDYKEYHRARLEYLSRQAHDLAVQRLQREHRS